MPVLDPAAVARWLHREAERLKTRYEDARAWSERKHATPALQRVASDQRDAAMDEFWQWTEEIAPRVMSFLNQRLRRSVSILATTMPRARDW